MVSKNCQSLVNTVVLFRHGELFSYYGILYLGFRASLNFRKFKVALNPMYRIALNVSLNLSIYYSFRHVPKPGTPEHHNTPEYPG